MMVGFAFKGMHQFWAIVHMGVGWVVETAREKKPKYKNDRV